MTRFKLFLSLIGALGLFFFAFISYAVSPTRQELGGTATSTIFTTGSIVIQGSNSYAGLVPGTDGQCLIASSTSPSKVAYAPCSSSGVTSVSGSGSILSSGGTTPTIQLQNLTASDILFGQGNNIIGTSTNYTFNTTSNTETITGTSTVSQGILIGATTYTSPFIQGQTPLGIKGNTNNYLEANIQNTNNGSSASSDYISTADNGSASTYYTDMGINGSGYSAISNVSGVAGDSYLYSSDKSMYLYTSSTTNATANLYLGVQGLTVATGTPTGFTFKNATTSVLTLTGINGSFLATNPSGQVVSTTTPQMPITLTTTGSSGAATFISNVLNIPQYTGGGGSASSTWTQYNGGQYNGLNAASSTEAVTIGSTTPQITSQLFLQGNGAKNPLLISSSTGTALLQVLANGNVGIGTITPVQLLDVNGLLDVNNTASSTYGGYTGINARNPYAILDVRSPQGTQSQVSPMMTNYSVPLPYTVTTSGDTGGGNQAYNMWNTGQTNNSAKWTDTASTTGYNQIDMAFKYLVNSYTMTQISGSNNFNPVNFTLQGSNDGSAFTVLDTETGISWTSNVPKVFPLASNSTYYRYYRLNVTAVNGGSFIEVDSLQLMQSGTPLLQITPTTFFSSSTIATFTAPLMSVGTSASGTTITTPGNELILQQTGDSLGGSSLEILNRSGLNGARFNDPTFDLVDFIFNPSSGVSSNIRYGHGSFIINSSNTAGEFQLGAPANPSFFTGAAVTAIKNGKLGIGTTTPASYLQIQDVAANGAPLFTINSSTSTTILNVSNSGLVGIGTSTSANALAVIGSISSSALTSGNCVQAGAGGLLTTVGAACGSGGSGNSAWTIGSGLIFNATSTDSILIGTSTPTTSTLFIQGTGAKSTYLNIASSTGATVASFQNSAFPQVNIGTTTNQNIANLYVLGSSATSTAPLLVVASSTGTSLLTVAANGNVGINSTTPGALLSVTGQSGSLGLLANIASSSNISELAVAANGNVGVGTSTPRQNFYITYPGAPATANNTTRFVVQNGGYANTFMSFGADSFFGNFFMWNSGNVGGGQSDMRFAKATDDAGTGFTELFRMSNSGQFLIGTSTSTSKLQVFGTAGSTNALFDAASSTGTSLMRVLSNGNVGINSTTPNFKLSIAGTVGMTSLTSSAAGNQLCHLSTGEVVDSGSATNCALSSQFVKYDISTMPLDVAQKELDMARAVLFTYKDNDQKRYGFIAEEMDKIDPRLTEYAQQDITLDGHLFKKGDPLAVNYNAVTALTLRVVQGQQEQIKGLQEQKSGFNYSLLGLLGLLGFIPIKKKSLEDL